MLTPSERKVIYGITFAVVVRMLGLFLLLPVIAPYVRKLEGSTPMLTGLAVGAYGLTQALLQIPFGYLSDKIGRKPVIVGGFLAYIFGSLMGAFAGNIWFMILARFVQGAGAISSSAVALAADLIREEVRTRAFAQIGASIGLTFALSLVIAPYLGGTFGVPFIFLATAFLSFLAMLYIAFFIKEPVKKEQNTKGSFGEILKNKKILSINLSVALLHALLVALFTFVPVNLVENFSFPKQEHWKIYLPIILISIALMVPSTILAEKRGKIKEVMFLGVLLVGLSFPFLIIQDLKSIFLCLLLYFIGFHFLEPVLPSLLTKLAGENLRGFAVGVYNTSQFSGAFLGGLIGGLALKKGVWFLSVVGTGLSLVWLAILWFSFRDS